MDEGLKKNLEDSKTRVMTSWQGSEKLWQRIQGEGNDKGQKASVPFFALGLAGAACAVLLLVAIPLFTNEKDGSETGELTSSDNTTDDPTSITFYEEFFAVETVSEDNPEAATEQWPSGESLALAVYDAGDDPLEDMFAFYESL